MTATSAAQVRRGRASMVVPKCGTNRAEAGRHYKGFTERRGMRRHTRAGYSGRRVGGGWWADGHLSQGGAGLRAVVDRVCCRCCARGAIVLSPLQWRR